MSSDVLPIRDRWTLALCTVLHALTHAYGAILVPLYLLMRDDLRLSGVNAAALIVSIYMAAYFLLGYPAGIVADHTNRKAVLGIGLVGNGAAIALMALTHQYWILVALAIMAGVFGSVFHPAANALVSAHFPKWPGMAIGMMGIGSGIGFFVGSQYSGWRAETALAPIWGMSRWQVPCLELGLAGIVVGILFLLIAREVAHASDGRGQPMGKGMRRRVLAIAMTLGCRDFAGAAAMTLLSIYLQRAHHYSVKETGWILGAMGLVSIVATPLAVAMTAGRRRLIGLTAIVMCGGITLMTVPHLAPRWLLPVLTIFQIFQLGSYAVAEVALIEMVSPAVRGRVIGLFLTVAGTLGAIAPWIVGLWTDMLGARADHPSGYIMPFAALALLMMIASFSVRLIEGLRRIGQPLVLPASPIAPAYP